MLLALLGAALNVKLLTLFEPDVAVALDFDAYYFAAERVVAGSSLYMTVQQANPGSAYCGGCYLYPPFLAQVLAPITLVSLGTAKVIWIVFGYVVAFSSIWLATGIGGAARSLERAIWCLAAVLLAEAATSAIWVGNVGTIVALSVTMVALGGMAAGIGAGLGVLLKVAPGTLLPAALVGERESRFALVASLGIVAGSSFLIAPGAWLDYPGVLWNVFATSSAAEGNLAIGEVASQWGWGPDAVSLVRVLAVSAGGACILLSIWLARRLGGMPAAALFGTVAMLVIPGTLWIHYLVVLLPFAAMAWPRAGAASRSLLVTSSAMVGISSFVDETLLSVYFGSALLVIVAGWELWPRRPGAKVAGPTPLHREGRAAAQR